jgi:hypothetical protein
MAMTPPTLQIKNCVKKKIANISRNEFFLFPSFFAVLVLSIIIEVTKTVTNSENLTQRNVMTHLFQCTFATARTHALRGYTKCRI